MKKDQPAAQEAKHFLILHHFVESWSELFRSALNAYLRWREERNTHKSYHQNLHPHMTLYSCWDLEQFGLHWKEILGSWLCQSTPNQMIAAWHCFVPLTRPRARTREHEHAASPCVGVVFLKPRLCNEVLPCSSDSECVPNEGILCKSDANYAANCLCGQKHTSEVANTPRADRHSRFSLTTPNMIQVRLKDTQNRFAANSFPHTLGRLLLQVQMAWVGVDARPVHGIAKAGMREAHTPRGDHQSSRPPSDG